MAIQEFDRPLRMREQSRRTLETCLSLTLLLAAVVFISYTIMSLPRPASEQPLPYRQLSEMPSR